MARGDGETWLQDQPVGRRALVDLSDAGDVFRVVEGIVAVGLGAHLAATGGATGAVRALAIAMMVIWPLEWLLGPRLGLSRDIGATRIALAAAGGVGLFAATFVVEGDRLLTYLEVGAVVLLVVDATVWLARRLDRRFRGGEDGPPVPTA